MENNWYRVGKDLLARNIWVKVPLDWEKPKGEQIDVFAREIIAPENVSKSNAEVPPILYLQGGPGGKGNRPFGRDPFLTVALKRFRVVFADQRGTGRSTPAHAKIFSKLSPEQAGQRLSLMLQTSIVKDFEELRRLHFSDTKWWTIGQSYGGFLTLTYLSLFPDSLVGSLITGGLPSLDLNAEAVYEKTFELVKSKNTLFFDRFPHLRNRVDAIADHLQNNTVKLPDGDILTVRRFQMLGMNLGTDTGFDRLLWILDEAFTDPTETVLSDFFLLEVMNATSYVADPLYIVLQEAIYGPGPANSAAEKVRERSQIFDESARPLQFTGEMAFPWMFEEIRSLKPYKAGWEELSKMPLAPAPYDESVLAKNEVPIEAAVYFEDMYVPTEFSLDTHERVGGLRVLVTNEFEHDGIRTGDTVEKLLTRLELRIAEQTANSKKVGPEGLEPPTLWV